MEVQEMGRKSLNWIKINLKIFYYMEKYYRLFDDCYKPMSELIYTSIINKNDSKNNLQLVNMLNKFETDELFIVKNFEPVDISRILMRYYLSKEIVFSDECMEKIKFFPYRQQLELIMYKSLLDGIDINKYDIQSILDNTIINQELRKDNFNLLDIYEFTHEVMYLTVLGRYQHKILINKRSYIEETIKYLIIKMLRINNCDLLAELLLISELLRIELEPYLRDESNKKLLKFVNDSMSKKAKSPIEKINNFNIRYHTMLVISSLSQI